MASKVTKDQEPIPYQALLYENNALKDEIQSLRARLEGPEELQRAISEGDLDALVMPVSEEDMRVFTLNSADQAYPILMETNLLDNISDVVYSTDDQFRLVYWNQAAEKVYGWKKGEVIGKNVIEATGSTFNPQTRARLTVELQERGSVTAEIVHTTRSGEHFIFDSNTMVLRDAGGKVVGYVAVNRDITERKQAEVEIQKLVASVQLEKDRLLTLVNSIPDEVWFADTQKKISLVNPAVLKEFDSSTFDNADVEAIAGSSEVYRPDGTPRPVEEAPPLRALKGEIIRNQEEIVRTTVSGELRYRQVNAGPVKDADGNIIGSVSVVRDITDSKRAEEALRESEHHERERAEELAILLDAVPTPVFIAHNPDSSHITGNSAADALLHNLPGAEASLSAPTESKPRHFKAVKDGRELSTEELPAQRAAQGFQVQDFEFSLIFDDGTKREVLGYGTPLWDEEGQPRGAVHVLVDITERKKTEEALREGEARFRSVLDNSIDVIYRMNVQTGHYEYVSPSAESVVGFSPAELMALDSEASLSMIHPDDLPGMRAAMARREYNGKVEAVYRQRTKSGNYRWISNHMSLVNDRTGRPLYRNGNIRDITELKEAETKLKETLDNLDKLVKERTAELEEAYNSLKKSEVKYRNIVETANEGIWTADAEYRTTYVNKKLAEMLGYNPEEMIGKLGIDFVDEEYKPFSIQDRKRKLQGIDDTHENKLIRKDGSLLWVLVNSKALFAKDGKFTGLLAMFTDITERKKAEEKIRSLANIVESSNDAIITKSLDGIITSWNKGAEQVYGYSAKEILGKPISILSLSYSDEETKKLIERIKKGENIQQYETSRLRKDGTIIYASISLSPVFDSSGKLAVISVTARDITESKKAEEALAKIEIARKKEIHHRIKNNLQVISSLLDLQSEVFNGRECIRDSEVLEAFRESQNRVISMALIHEEMYKGNGFKGEGFELLNFSPYIKELAENLFQTYRLGNTDTSLNLDLEENLFFDIDTAVPLGIIVNELVSNSLKHAFQGKDSGEIRIELHREESKSEDCKGTSFILIVSDNGIGIPENLEVEDLDSLGMQLVTTLVDQLDGELELKRNSGTEFTMRFAVIEKNNQASAPASQQLVE